jgi:hypothetical protein
MRWIALVFVVGCAGPADLAMQVQGLRADVVEGDRVIGLDVAPTGDECLGWSDSPAYYRADGRADNAMIGVWTSSMPLMQSEIDTELARAIADHRIEWTLSSGALQGGDGLWVEIEDREHRVIADGIGQVHDGRVRATLESSFGDLGIPLLPLDRVDHLEVAFDAGSMSHGVIAGSLPIDALQADARSRLGVGIGGIVAESIIAPAADMAPGPHGCTAISFGLAFDVGPIVGTP